MNNHSEKSPQNNKIKILISPDIINRFREGDHHAFEIIFNTFYLKIQSFIYNLTNDYDLAQELTQEVFTDLWINREKIDSEKNINAYIYSIARNNTFTALKQQVKYELSRFDFNEKTDTTLTDDQLIAKETELLINLTVAGMPAKRKQVYEMSRNQNKTNHEIAKELNISRKVVEKHLRLALKELKDKIGIVSFLFL